MQHDVALLRRGRLQVGQALPRLEILRADQAGLRDRARQVAGLGVRVLGLGAERAVDVAVLVEGDAHVIDVGLRLELGQVDGLGPEAPAVDAVGALGDREEALAVVALEADDHVDLPLPVERAGVERGIDAEAFHQERIGLRVEVEAPLDRRVAVGDGRVSEALEHAVVPLGVDGVPAREEFLVLRAQLLEPRGPGGGGFGLGRGGFLFHEGGWKEGRLSATDFSDGHG